MADSRNPEIFRNSVKSLEKAPHLIIFCPENRTEWCNQYTQEGYHVLHIPYPSPSPVLAQLMDSASNYLAEQASDSLAARLGGVGLIVFGIAESDSESFSAFCHSISQLRAIVHYCPAIKSCEALNLNTSLGGKSSATSYMFHLAASQETLHASLLSFSQADATGHSLEHGPAVDVHTYPLIPESPPFPLLTGAPTSVVPGKNSTVNPHVLSAGNVAYSKTLALLRRKIGPCFDLEKIWGEHIRYEFAERDALSKKSDEVFSVDIDALTETMETMVDVPYVNHVPTMTGGVGKEDLTRFYMHHFTSETVTPPDTEIITISRTIGSDRIIDEMIFKATHTCEIDYLLPGIKPTGKHFEVALVGVIAFRGDKLCFEHIYWDQASLLLQLGLLPEPENGLPVAGKESAQKVMNPFGMPSNTLMKRWKLTEGRA